MLVHICCSVDSHFFLQKLREAYPDEPLIGFFYDPNIHPYDEYRLRLLDVRRSCRKLGIVLWEGSYDYEAWINAVRGLEHEPEKGKRCNVCFDNRLEESAKKALELGEKIITTTLLTSPKKSLQQLEQALETIAQKYGLAIVVPDFRKDGGTQAQFALARDAMLYHQNYCGCVFALAKQREQQKRFADELCSPLRPQCLSGSIEERLRLYEAVICAEEERRPFRLVREKFLNYRLLRAWLQNDAQEIVPSYILFYSTCQKKVSKTRVAFIASGVGYATKEEIRFVTIDRFNETANTCFCDVKEMLRNPPDLECEMKVRAHLFPSAVLSLSPIIIVDTLDEREYTLFLESVSYPDIRENLVFIS
ncbi:MAG: epoxyqueuosine reductase QueH [Sulfurospirillum cavolei]|nr:epoxyqueuosine reductase QueH [Sulfurospirillum cavolei]